MHSKREEELNTFINNAGKATQKQEVFYDAFKPKELDVTLDYSMRFLSVIVFVIFVWWAL